MIYFSDFNAAGGGGYGSHRYWRIYVTANAGGPSFTSIGEIQFRSTSGGTDITGSGTALEGGAGSVQSGSEAAKAFDNDTSSFWSRNATGGVWVGYDFGSNVTVAEFTLAPWSAASAYYAQFPQAFTLDYSDDGSSWTTAESFTAQGWNVGVADAYPKDELGTNEARMWRVFVPTVDSGTLTICANLEWRATAGGADQSAVLSGGNDANANGRAIYSSQGFGNEAWRAYDGGASSDVWAGTSGTNEWIGYVFPAPVTIAQIAYTFWSQDYRWNPSEIRIQYSNDNGTTWTTAATYTGITSTASETKLYSV